MVTNNSVDWMTITRMGYPLWRAVLRSINPHVHRLELANRNFIDTLNRYQMHYTISPRQWGWLLGIASQVDIRLDVMYDDWIPDHKKPQPKFIMVGEVGEMGVDDCRATVVISSPEAVPATVFGVVERKLHL